MSRVRLNERLVFDKLVRNTACFYISFLLYYFAW